MKRQFFTLLIIAMMPIIRVWSQCDSIGHFNFVATAGVGVAHLRLDNNESYDNGRSIVHMQISALADYTVFQNFFVESGLSFQHKGWKRNHTGYTDWEKNTYHLFYIQIPMTANYKIPIEKVWLTPQIGPYIGIAAGGNYTREGIETTIDSGTNHYHYHEKLFSNYNRNKYRKFDCGLGIAVNVLWLNKFRAGMGYDIGFVNLRKKLNGQRIASKNGAFSIQFGYYIK